MIVPCFSFPFFGIAQRNPHLQYEKRQNQQEPTATKKGLYQVGVLIQLFRVSILIQLQQNTLNGFFLNTAWTEVLTLE